MNGALEKFIQIESGIQLSLEDINSYDMELIPWIKSIKSDLEQKEIKKNMPKGKK